MSLLSRLKRSKPEAPAEPVLSDDIPAAELPVIIPQPHGRVVKGAKRREYTPFSGRKGGRVVKAMPRNLQKIKEAQEKPVEDD
jgi:hypothetical protein